MTCIIFKDGKNKTIEYAINNKINVLNPLWVHESILKQEPLDMENYFIKKTFTDLLLENSIQSHSLQKNKKRKYEEFSKSPEKSESLTNVESSNKKKLNHSINIEKNRKIVDLKGILKTSTFEKNLKNDNENNKREIKDETEVDQNSKESIAKEVAQSKKITNFFKPITTSKHNNSVSVSKTLLETEKISEDNDNISKSPNVNSIKDKEVLLSSIAIGEENKFKINSIITQLAKYKYIGEKLENINQSECVVIKENTNKNDLRLIYALIHKKPIIYINYFSESLKQTCYKDNISDFTFSKDEIKFINSELSELPFKTEKFRIFLHPSLYEKEILKKDAYLSILKKLGVDEPENSIRLADICIINKINNNEYFPGHVKLLNDSFIFDCLYNLKVMDLNNWKYQPELESFNKK